MPEIELKNITKVYGNKKAAENISFAIKAGESVGLVGESGCGKSTVASIIAGLIKADSGSIYIDGKNLKKLNSHEYRNYRRNVQMVFQDSSSALNPRLTAGKCISEPIENFLNLNKNEVTEITLSLLCSVGLDKDDYFKYPRQFSGGQRQRICIARAISIKPELILLDEVTSNLDVSVQAQILNLLVDLKQKHNIGYLFISHDLGVVRYMCDKILVMYRGNIMEVISENDIKNSLHPYTKFLLSSVPSIHNDILSSVIPECNRKEANNKGCKFYNRCLIRKEQCFENKPPLRQIKNGHFISCFAIS